MTWEAITIEPVAKADACVIWLHGLGANGHDFESVVPELGLDSNHTIRFIFPHAPNQPVTLNAGYVMPAWYDIAAIDFSAPEDEKGIKRSQQVLNALIEENIKSGIPSNRIFLLGFSQGGALAIHTAIQFDKPLAGVGLLSGYLPLHQSVKSEKHKANEDISIFMAHGAMDMLVPLEMAQLSLNWLTQAGFKPMWHLYPMEHSVCWEELKDIGLWIKKQLSLDRDSQEQHNQAKM